MVVLLSGLIGAALGLLVARKKGGNRLDKAQYAGVFALILMIIGLFLTIAIERMA